MLSSTVYKAWYFKKWMELAEARRLKFLKTIGRKKT
jgi:hypothetical protein